MSMCHWERQNSGIKRGTQRKSGNGVCKWDLEEEFLGYFAKGEIHCLCPNLHSVNLGAKVPADFWLIFLPIVGLL